jgi:hypothetical protein
MIMSANLSAPIEVQSLAVQFWSASGCHLETTVGGLPELAYSAASDRSTWCDERRTAQRHRLYARRLKLRRESV